MDDVHRHGFVAYPRAVYHFEKGERIVRDPDALAALGEGWCESVPAALRWAEEQTRPADVDVPKKRGRK